MGQEIPLALPAGLTGMGEVNGISDGGVIVGVATEVLPDWMYRSHGLAWTAAHPERVRDLTPPGQDRGCTASVRTA